MANAALENLSAAGTVAGTDLVPIKQAGATLLKGTVNQLATGILSGDAVASAGTANGILYLNGSKVASSGSALTFDGTVLGVNGGLVADPNLLVQINSPAASQKFFAANKAGDYGLLMGYDTINDIARLRVIPNTALTFETNNAEAMRLTSTGLGVGTSSPGAKLDVNGSVTFNGKLFSNPAASISGDVAANLVNTSATGYGARIAGGASGAGYALSVNNYAGAELLLLNGAGNLGLGVTPDYKLHVGGAIGFAPGASVAPVSNGDVVIEATNNTTLTFKLKGSDGTTRSGTVTLA